MHQIDMNLIICSFRINPSFTVVDPPTVPLMIWHYANSRLPVSTSCTPFMHVLPVLALATV